MSNGEGCNCFARSKNECACGVNWNQKPLSDEEISELKVKEGLGNWYNFARAIEKHHGIG